MAKLVPRQKKKRAKDTIAELEAVLRDCEIRAAGEAAVNSTARLRAALLGAVWAFRCALEDAVIASGDSPLDEKGILDATDALRAVVWGAEAAAAKAGGGGGARDTADGASSGSTGSGSTGACSSGEESAVGGRHGSGSLGSVGGASGGESAGAGGGAAAADLALTSLAATQLVPVLPVLKGVQGMARSEITQEGFIGYWSAAMKKARQAVRRFWVGHAVPGEIEELMEASSVTSVGVLVFKPWALWLLRIRLDTGEPTTGAPPEVYDEVVSQLDLSERQATAMAVLREWWEASSVRLEARRKQLADKAAAAPGDLVLQEETAAELEGCVRMYPICAAAAILAAHTCILASGQILWFQAASYPYQPTLTGFLDAVDRTRHRRGGGGRGLGGRGGGGAAA